MTIETIEERLITLETRFDALQRQVEVQLPPVPSELKRGWKAIIGTFANEPLYEEAMRHGRAWRESQFDETDAEAI